jgi:hypothetical protein
MSCVSLFESPEYGILPAARSKYRANIIALPASVPRAMKRNPYEHVARNLGLWKMYSSCI